MRAFRLLRGMVSTAIAWGLAWAVLGAASTILTGRVRGYDVPLGTYASVAFSAALFYAIVGVWAGGIFAITMTISERRHTFTELRMSRVITWGVLGGVSYPLLGWILSTLTGLEIGGLATAFALSATFGALSAWAMLRLARRAADPEPSQLGAGGVGSWTARAEAESSDRSETPLSPGEFPRRRQGTFPEECPYRRRLGMTPGRGGAPSL